MLKIIIPKTVLFAFTVAVAFSELGHATGDHAVLNDTPATQVKISNQFWWPERLDLSPLRQQSIESNPMGENFKYSEEFKKLNLKEVKEEIKKIMTTSQDWWPSDYGHYGPFFIRMAWHSAGTYRTTDGRGGAGGGQQRFEPLNSWPDNASLDKARRLLWPVKQKYGRKISWADLMILTGNVALESMGFKTFGYAGGRIDDWEADQTYWGPEKKFLGDERYSGNRKLKKPLAAVQMGLIYVNPEGPNGNPDPLLAAKDIRETFGRMAMNDEETVALIAGGHTFGKAHGNGDAGKCIGVAPAGGGLEEQGFGWKNKCKTGKGVDTITSGLEGAWTASPTQWTHQYLAHLFGFEWEKTKSPAGATQWIPKGGRGADLVPDAHDKTKKHAPIMFTTDLALRMDPDYEKIARRFLEDPHAFELAFAKAWFKLTHRDMGPRARYLGNQIPLEVSKGELLWQDPIPAAPHRKINAAQIADLKKQIAKTQLSVGELVRTAWASAASFRRTDKRGGANGARIRLAPQKDWAVNNPDELAEVLSHLEEVQKSFNRKNKQVQVSLADLIVLGGSVGIEHAARAAGKSIHVPFIPGRTDATQEQTDVHTFAVLEPKADAFRNYYGNGNPMSPAQMLVERADMLSLTVPEMTVLIGGLRVLDANSNHSKNGVLTENPGQLSRDFFINLLDMSTQWKKSDISEGIYVGIDRRSGEKKWTATPVDLIFGSHSELRPIVEVYAAADGEEKFMKDFVKAWEKVMMLDRYEVK